MGILQPPVVLVDQSRDLNDRFYLILNELVKTYSLAKTHPNDISPLNSSKTNLESYSENMALMLALQNDYFLYKNNVNSAIDSMIKTIGNGNNQLNELESQNKVLHLQLDNLKNSSNQAEGLFDDAQITRNQLLVSNWILFGIIVGGGFIYYKSLKTTAQA